MSEAGKKVRVAVQPSGYFVGKNSGFKVTRIVKKRRVASSKGVH